MKFAQLLLPISESELEELARQAQKLTQQHFGKTIQIYAPLYLSNECVNQCVYCGFNSKVFGKRISLTVEQAVAEATILSEMGFKHILLVSGEDRKKISIPYLKNLTSHLSSLFSSISIEIYPMEENEYRELFKAGVDGLTVYQEVYDRVIYKKVHPVGPKSDYNFRLAAAERGARAGFYRINIGSLLGLGDWESETIALAQHAQYLQKKYWKSQISISFPRLRGFKGEHPVSDRQLAQMVIALRIFLPKAGLVLSTREPPELRDHLLPLGITQMSAASRTAPGAYGEKIKTSQQFEIADKRNVTEVATAILKGGYDPVFKDWDKCYNA
ncbi:2-iminoacetate synthase ThiH [Candidatus Margulisiibacteriota bacterium]